MGSRASSGIHPLCWVPFQSTGVAREWSVGSLSPHSMCIDMRRQKKSTLLNGFQPSSSVSPAELQLPSPWSQEVIPHRLGELCELWRFQHAHDRAGPSVPPPEENSRQPHTSLSAFLPPRALGALQGAQEAAEQLIPKEDEASGEGSLQ